MEITLASNGLAEAEGEDDSEDLDAQDGDGHDDDDIQVRDDPVVHCFVATLKIIMNSIFTENNCAKNMTKTATQITKGLSINASFINREECNKCQ